MSGQPGEPTDIKNVMLDGREDFILYSHSKAVCFFFHKPPLTILHFSSRKCFFSIERVDCMTFQFKEPYSNGTKPCQGVHGQTYQQAFRVIEGTWSSASFFAVYLGHTPIVYQHTSLHSLLLLYINDHSSQLLFIPLELESNENQRFWLQLTDHSVFEVLGEPQVSVQRGNSVKSSNWHLTLVQLQMQYMHRGDSVLRTEHQHKTRSRCCSTSEKYDKLKITEGIVLTKIMLKSRHLRSTG